MIEIYMQQDNAHDVNLSSLYGNQSHWNQESEARNSSRSKFPSIQHLRCDGICKDVTSSDDPIKHETYNLEFLDLQSNYDRQFRHLKCYKFIMFSMGPELKQEQGQGSFA